MTKRAKCVFQLVVAYSYSLDLQFSTLSLTLLLQFYILITCEAHLNDKVTQYIFNKWTLISSAIKSVDVPVAHWAQECFNSSDDINRQYLLTRLVYPTMV